MQLATCHPNRKHQARGLCGACYMRWLKEHNPNYHAKYKAYQIKISADPVEKERRKELTKRRNARELNDPNHKRKQRARTLYRKYKITIDQYDKMLSEQGGGCAICGRLPGNLALHVDHCHESGVVRGILCHQCNWYLGTLEGSPVVINNLLFYLEKIHAIKRDKS